MTYLTLAFATLITSIISGVLSMAGGMILMGVFGFFLSVPAAMVLHGIAQAVSNGSRVWLHRHHVRWNVLLPYAAGSFITLAIFISVAFIPNKAVLFILIGSFPFLTFVIPKRVNLDMVYWPVSFFCGLLVTATQMLAGASGPVLDIFYIQSSLTRFEILGTKAITQTLGHLIKLSYYAYFLTLNIDLPWWICPSIVIAAIFGNWLGKKIVDRMNDASYKKIGKIAIMVVGGAYIAKGISELSVF